MNALLPWHASLWSRLAPRIVEARLPHALLLCGPTGVGKAGFAQVLTQSLLCEKVQADGYACGNCNACHLFAIGNHPDLLYIEPEEDAKTITVDKIRALSAFMNLMPQHARTRVVVVPQAHLMNSNAANSLLKNLEEPPSHGKFILITDRLSSLLPTIRSRCQRIDFTPPPLAEARTWLHLQPHQGDSDAALALADGAPLRALHLMQEGAWPRRAAVFEEFQRMVSGAQEPVALAEKWLKSNPADILHWMESWLSDIVRCKLAQDAGRWRNPDFAGPLTRLADGVDVQAVLTLLTHTQKALRGLSTSANVQLMLEGIAIDCTALRALPVSTNGDHLK